MFWLFLCPSSLLSRLSSVFIVVIQFFMQFKVKLKHAQESSMQSLVCTCVLMVSALKLISTFCLLYSIGKAILKTTTEQTQVPTVIIM